MNSTVEALLGKVRGLGGQEKGEKGGWVSLSFSGHSN